MIEQAIEQEPDTRPSDVDLKQIVLLKEIIKNELKEKDEISFVEIGIHDSKSSLIYTLINPKIKQFIGIDEEICFTYNDILDFRKLRLTHNSSGSKRP